MKTVILAGGAGSRLSEETIARPKPMVEVGGRPILLHIMEIYGRQGFKDFIVACGYKGEVIKRYFNEIHILNSDFTIDLASGGRETINGHDYDWRVSLIDTGQKTMTGGRVRRLAPHLKDATFMVTYGDGVGDIDIPTLVAFHKAHGKLATVTAVRPTGRFGALRIEHGEVREFAEKVEGQRSRINGGFFVFEPRVLDYIASDETPLEEEPLANLARDGQLMAFEHDGFWHPMDTLRDRTYLDSLCNGDRSPWSGH